MLEKIRASRGDFPDSVFAPNVKNPRFARCLPRQCVCSKFQKKIRASRGAFPDSVFKLFGLFPQTLRARTDGDGELRINCSCPYESAVESAVV